VISNLTTIMDFHFPRPPKPSHREETIVNTITRVQAMPIHAHWIGFFIARNKITRLNCSLAGNEGLIYAKLTNLLPTCLERGHTCSQRIRMTMHNLS
jgi:hypothetical protein